jgi:Uma2 family endonuclease
MRAVVADFPPHWLAERKRSGAHRFDEFWDGVLHVPPPRTGRHQDLLADLTEYLHTRRAKPRGCRADHNVNVATPADEPSWLHNFRIADIVLLTPDRFAIDKIDYMAGPPLVVVEIKSPGDETYDKFPFYAGLGVPEVWVFDRDTRAPELYALGPGPAYLPIPAGPDGWVTSPAAGVEFRHLAPNKVTARLAGDPASAADLPDD